MKQPATNLTLLQANAEATAKTLKAARTSLATAKLNLDKAEEAYAAAQKTFQSGVEQVKNATKVV